MQLKDVEKYLDAADNGWRSRLRPNLTGDEAILFVIHDIALERKLLANEVMEHRSRLRPNPSVQGEPRSGFPLNALLAGIRPPGEDMDNDEFIRESIDSVRRLAAGDPEGRLIYERIADDRLVRAAANAMTEKLQLARVKGRGGWWDSSECSIEHLRELLRKHIEKGDMRDVMNLAAMVYVRQIADMPANT